MLKKISTSELWLKSTKLIKSQPRRLRISSGNKFSSIGNYSFENNIFVKGMGPICILSARNFANLNNAVLIFCSSSVSLGNMKLTSISSNSYLFIGGPKVMLHLLSSMIMSKSYKSKSKVYLIYC